MKFILVLTILTIMTACVKKEVDISTHDDIVPANLVDIAAVFNYKHYSGPSAVTKYIQNKLNYPEVARETNTEGRVIVSFIIVNDGSVKNVSIVHSSGANSLDTEALRVIKGMPDWIPAKNKNGDNVQMKYSIPIKFKLAE